MLKTKRGNFFFFSKFHLPSSFSSITGVSSAGRAIESRDVSVALFVYFSGSRDAYLRIYVTHTHSPRANERASEWRQIQSSSRDAVSSSTRFFLHSLAKRVFLPSFLLRSVSKVKQVNRTTFLPRFRRHRYVLTYYCARVGVEDRMYSSAMHFGACHHSPHS